MSKFPIDHFYDEITAVINHWDPIDLLRYNDNEYQDEIDQLMEQLKYSSSVDLICRYVKKIFKESFGAVCDCSEEDFYNVAQQIYNILHDSNT